MLPEMTAAVARAIDLARRIADGEAGPADLLRGLLAEDEGRACRVVTEAGLDVNAWRGELRPDPAALAELSAELLALLARAKRLARELTEDGIVTGELVVLAALRTQKNLVAEWTAAGLDADALERRLVGETNPIPLADDSPTIEPIAVETRTAEAPPWRVIDAAANRANEALRVLEDYVRFLSDDEPLTRSLKQMRHELRETLAPWRSSMLAARDTPRDVGTRVGTVSEYRRSDAGDVAAANAKRLQESLRCLEEFGKLIDPARAARFEQMRYRAYTLEQTWIRPAGQGRRKLSEAVLYLLVSADGCPHGLEVTVREAIAGGVQAVQLREKSLPDRQLLESARRMRDWTAAAGVLFFVNDRADVARSADADGVHLGQDDFPVKEARAIVGQLLIGVSTHTTEQLRSAQADGADYVGVGPTFPSPTKDFAEFPGLDFVRASATATIPAFALGGITEANVADVVRAGGRRIAVSAAITRSSDPRKAAATLRQYLADTHIFT